MDVIDLGSVPNNQLRLIKRHTTLLIIRLKEYLSVELASRSYCDSDRVP
jgi:hypothetical protein